MGRGIAGGPGIAKGPPRGGCPGTAAASMPGSKPIGGGGPPLRPLGPQCGGAVYSKPSGSSNSIAGGTTGPPLFSMFSTASNMPTASTRASKGVSS
jgi:hypothetical protein